MGKDSKAQVRPKLVGKFHAGELDRFRRKLQHTARDWTPYCTGFLRPTYLIQPKKKKKIKLRDGSVKKDLQMWDGIMTRGKEGPFQ